MAPLHVQQGAAGAPIDTTRDTAAIRRHTVYNRFQHFLPVSGALLKIRRDIYFTLCMCLVAGSFCLLEFTLRTCETLRRFSPIDEVVCSVRR